MAVDEDLRRRREEICLGHMQAENAHRFDEAIGFFARPRYELVATGEVYDGAGALGGLMHENVTAFPDFHYEVSHFYHSDDVIVVEGSFRGTHEGKWRGLPPTGRRVDFPMLIVFPFEGDRMMGERIYFDISTALRQLGVARDPNTVAGKIATAFNHPITLGRALLRGPQRRAAATGAAVARSMSSTRPKAEGSGLPPGSMGLPFVGETPAFVRNPYRFLEIRRDRYGDVFRSNVTGRRVVFLSGIEGASAFYDPENVGREDAHPFLMTDMFGGTNFEMYDGPRHFALKTIALQAFDEAALAGYLPDIQLAIESWLERHADGAPFQAMTALRGLAIEAICRNVLGLGSGAETETMTRDYGLLLAGLAATVPVRIPGTTYGRAMSARDRLLTRIRTIVEERRARPRADGLSQILSATAPDGRTYTDDEAVLEVHHIVVAGFVVYAHMAEVLRRLAVQPSLRARCAEEAERYAPDGPLSMEGLSRLDTSRTVVMEAKRFVPLVPLAFGRAGRTFACGRYEVPEGWTVYLALHLINRDPTIYFEPERFDPDRFGPGREEHHKHPLAFIPQGSDPPTSHRCLGLEYSTLLTLAFLAILVRGYDWRLPSQRLELDWGKRPPEPRDGLIIQLRSA